MPTLPGVASATEVQLALDSGLTWMKTFPASVLGAGWISAMAGPFPQARFVATGGMDSSNATEFLGAGAQVVALLPVWDIAPVRGGSVVPNRSVIHNARVAVVGLPVAVLPWGMNLELIFTADVDAYGAGRRSLARRCSSGELLRLRPGVYVPAAAWQQLPPWARETTRLRAAEEQGQGNRILIQQSAAPFWGLPVIGVSDVMLLAVLPSHGRRRGELCWTVRKLLEPIAVVAGMPLTSRAQTAIDMAAYLDFDRAVPAMDRVLRPDPGRALPALEKGRLQELAGGLPAQARRNRANRVLDFADPCSESAGESYSRAVLHRHGFPAPELQHGFITSTGRFRTDFYWKDHGLVGEFDGAVKYGRGASALTPSWDTLLREKRREDAIRATGVGFVRWSWSDVGRPAQHPASLVQRMLNVGLPRSRR